MSDLQPGLQGEWTFEKACSFVNLDHPAIASLLYDLDLMPEQLVSDEKRAEMVLIVAHMMTLERSFASHPMEERPGLRELVEEYRSLLGQRDGDRLTAGEWFWKKVAALASRPVEGKAETATTPNALTLQVMADTDAGRNVQDAASVEEMMKDLEAPAAIPEKESNNEHGV